MGNGIAEHFNSTLIMLVQSFSTMAVFLTRKQFSDYAEIERETAKTNSPNIKKDRVVKNFRTKKYCD